MKLRLLVLIASIPILSFGLVGAQSISLDHVDGLNIDGGLEMGVPVTFYLRLTNDNVDRGGITNGFRIYSPTGSEWSPAVADTTGTLGKTQFDGGFFIAHISCTGSDVDTVGFGGFRFYATGMPAGFDDVAYTIDIGPISASYEGGQICLDSTWYRNTGIWKWAGPPEVFPAWDGPHCFTIGDPQPEITCPEGTEIFLCNPDTICLDFEVSNAAWVEVAGPAYIEGEQVCVSILEEGTVAVTLVAWAGSVADSCAFEIAADFNEPPYVTAAELQDQVLCELGEQACVPFEVSDVDDNLVDVTCSPGTVVETQSGYEACFIPTAFDIFEIVLTAVDACGAEHVRTVELSVSQGDVAEISCPGNIQDTLCGAGTVCVPIAVSLGTDQVTVFPIGTYDMETGELCVDIEQSGIYNLTMIAEAECGADTCDLELDATVVESVHIDCPSSVINVLLCEPGQACLELPIANADVVETEGGIWEEGVFCFQADTSGTYEFIVTAGNQCGADTCHITAAVQTECPDVTTVIDPDTMLLIYSTSVEPMMATIYLGNLSDGHTVEDIDQTSLLVNGTLDPVSAEVIPYHPSFAGTVLQLTTPIAGFIDSYGLLWDTTLQIYTVSGRFLDDQALQESGEVIFLGRLVGDLNEDGSVDVSDLVMMVDYMFLGGPPPGILLTGDMDGNGSIDISDLIALVDYIFIR